MKVTTCHNFIPRTRMHGANSPHHQCSYMMGYWSVWVLHLTAVIRLHARGRSFRVNCIKVTYGHLSRTLYWQFDLNSKCDTKSHDIIVASRECFDIVCLWNVECDDPSYFGMSKFLKCVCVCVCVCVRVCVCVCCMYIYICTYQIIFPLMQKVRNVM